MKYLFDSPVATCTFSKVDDRSYFFNSMIMKKGKKKQIYNLFMKSVYFSPCIALIFKLCYSFINWVLMARIYLL